MAENFKFKTENYEEHRGGHEYHERTSKHHESRAENSKHEHRENIDRIMQQIEETAKSGSEMQKTEKAPVEQGNHRFVGKELKDNNLKRSLRRIQKDLKPYQRPLSKFIHNDLVEKLSEGTAKTIARPEGLLFGALASFLTSLGFLMLCRYYGYEYNYFVGLISFPIGFVIGLVGEAILWPLLRRRD